VQPVDWALCYKFFAALTKQKFSKFSKNNPTKKARAPIVLEIAASPSPSSSIVTVCPVFDIEKINDLKNASAWWAVKYVFKGVRFGEVFNLPTRLPADVSAFLSSGVLTLRSKNFCWPVPSVLPIPQTFGPRRNSEAS
jgi:hypothetical protein